MAVYALQISAISMGAEGAGIGNMGAFRALRTLRALRPLRAVSRWEGMKVCMSTFTLCLVDLGKFPEITLINKPETDFAIVLY